MEEFETKSFCVSGASAVAPLPKRVSGGVCVGVSGGFESKKYKLVRGSRAFVIHRV